jgi:TRAP-type C4-dicarboxylate transport system substrate-binding protein
VKKTGCVFFTIMVALILCMAPTAGAKTVNWPLAILWPASNFSTQGTVQFAKMVGEKTGGQLQIKVHAGGSLGFKGPEMLKVIRDGLAPIGEMLLGYVAGTEPLMDFSTMPFLVANAGQAEKLGAIARPAVEKVFDKWNQKMLYWQFWPGAGLYSQKPINSLADLKGLKIRTFNAVSTAWVKAAGGNPVSMPWGDVYMAMSTGAIDALITSSTSGADGKFWEVMKYFTKLNFTFGYSAVTVNKKSLAGLTGDQRKAVLAVAKEMEKIQLKRSLESDKAASAKLIKNGIKISEMSPKFQKACAALCGPIWSEWAKKAGPSAADILKKAKALD